MLQMLEDRLTPADIGWTIEADPEGYVFHDANGNSVFDAGESAVGAGWTVYVDSNDNAALDAGEINTTTDSAGHYNIFLPDGTYSIRVVPQGSFQTDARPFGTLLRDFPSIESGAPDNFSGLAWVDGSLYVTFRSNPNVVYQVDPQTGAALGPAVSLPGDVVEITFDGTDFWGAEPSGSLVRFDFTGQELQRLTFAGMNSTGVEWDGSALRVLDNTAKRIYRIDPSGTGTILGYINTPHENVLGLAFDGTSLWLNGTDSDRIYGLNPATGAVQRSFAAPGDLGLGLAVRGTNLWLSDNLASRIFEYDLGYGGGRIVTVAGADVTGVNLAVFQPGSISGRVFNDNNQNGLQDASDGGLAGWRVYDDANANGQFDRWETSAVTDALGNYTLSNLRPGPYTLSLDIAGQRLARWSQVAPAGEAYSISFGSGDAFSALNFANYLDRTTPVAPNEYGPFQGGELSFWTGLAWVNYSAVNFSPTGGSFWGNAEFAKSYVASSTHGGYDDWRLPSKTEAEYAAMNDVGPRIGAITLTNGNHYYWWTSTKSSGQRTWAVDLGDPAGFAASPLNSSTLYVAGVRDTGIVIDDGTAGYSSTGFSSKGASGAYQADQSTATAGNGSKTATWTFSGLEAGATYKVDVTWKAASGAASNAPFTILDGANVLGTRALNQRVAPDDYTVDTTAWEGLGTYTISGNTLTVRLSNLANGTVIADAVRIFKVLPSYAPAGLAAAGGGAAPQSATGPALTVADARPILNEAISRWQRAGADTSMLDWIHLRIANLGDSILGFASPHTSPWDDGRVYIQAGHTISLDDNAAGWGWFVDRTPQSDSEFRHRGDQGEQSRMDLLTVLMHEVGHLLGHNHDQGDIMAGTLAAGTRIVRPIGHLAPDLSDHLSPSPELRLRQVRGGR